MFELGTKALQYPDLVDMAKHRMQLMADTTGETVHLAKREQVNTKEDKELRKRLLKSR